MNVDEIEWPDAQLIDIAIDYDRVRLSVTTFYGAELLVVCDGFIDVRIRDFWDDTLLTSGGLWEPDPEVFSRWGELSRGAAGNETRNRRLFRTLRLITDDAASIEVTAGAFWVVEVGT